VIQDNLERGRAIRVSFSVVVLYLNRFFSQRRFGGCFRGVVFLSFAVALAAQPGGEHYPPPDELTPLPDFHIAVADTECRVLIAQVNLKIGDLTLAGDADPSLSGNYFIDVPIRQSKSESGSMSLPLERPIEEYLRDGGVLQGRGISFKNPEATRLITCQIVPDPELLREGTIHLSIDTGKRVMEFESTYAVEGEIPELSFSSEEAKNDVAHADEAGTSGECCAAPALQTSTAKPAS
jgi:hypothetical protein